MNFFIIIETFISQLIYFYLQNNKTWCIQTQIYYDIDFINQP